MAKATVYGWSCADDWKMKLIERKREIIEKLKAKAIDDAVVNKQICVDATMEAIKKLTASKACYN